MFERNSQLRSLLEKAGGDITRLDYDIETVTNDANEQVQVANIKMEDQIIGQLETTAPEGMMSEFMAYQTITGAPSLFGKGSKWKFYKTEGEEKPAAAAPAAGGEKKERFPVKNGAAPAAAFTAPAKEMTLEERISAKTSAPTSTRTATPEQLAGVKAGQVRQQKSSLESEATKLERALYDMPRTAGGKKQLKRGLSAQDPDVKSALQRIAEIKKQLEAL